jgi:glutamate synthase (NADPH/NADH) small chain
MPAYPHEVVEAEDEGVHFQWLAAPTRFLGEGRVEAMECVSMLIRDGRPEPMAGTEFTLSADTVVLAIGQAGPRIEVDDDWRTSDPRIFAAGDAVNGGNSAVEAVRGGRDAAIAIDRWLS